jgi:hypothetical protein
MDIERALPASGSSHCLSYEVTGTLGSGRLLRLFIDPDDEADYADENQAVRKQV